MRLEIDIGNTRIKWRTVRYDGIVAAHGSGLLAQASGLDAMDSVFDTVDLSAIEHVGVASVVPSVHPILTRWCEQRLGLLPEFARVVRYCAGVTNGYRDASQMGVDRWLAILAAYQRCAGAIVVSAGSAVTVDLLCGDGMHLGGYIVPGLRLMKESLRLNTDQVNIGHQQRQQSLVPGESTVEAVMRGVPLMVVGLVGDAVIRLQQHDGLGAPPVLVTGGDGEYLVSLMVARELPYVEYVPSLIFEGLSLALGDPVLPVNE